MSERLLIARTPTTDLSMVPAMANRHGLITGATGTGKTVTLQVMAERFSASGVPVFLADVKGDLTGLAQPGTLNPKLQARLEGLHWPVPEFAAVPTVLWDVYGQMGHPLRATVSALGPLLLARVLELNATQEGVLNSAFRIADEAGWLLLDLKDLRALLQYVGDHRQRFSTQYGHISTASVGAIVRALLVLEQQGAGAFLGEPMFQMSELLRTDHSGRGMVHILAAEALLEAPRLYGAVLLWLLSELFEHLPEVGDLPQPKLVFFFDEAHLLFAQASPALVERVEQVVRLVRSKGVGVYFVTQNPLDIPEKVLGQLGNRVQHALRAFTPRDQKAVRAAAQTMRANPALDAERVIGDLGVGEALVSFLDDRGRPQPVERAMIVPPGSRLGPLGDAERRAVLAASPVAGVYEQALDRVSAYECLQEGAVRAREALASVDAQRPSRDEVGADRGARGRPRADSLLEAVAKSAARSVASTVGRELVRGLLGTLLGHGRRR